MSYTQKQLEEMSDEEFVKVGFICLADEVAFAEQDAAELSALVLQVAAKRLNLAKEFEEIDTLGGY